MFTKGRNSQRHRRVARLLGLLCCASIALTACGGSSSSSSPSPNEGIIATTQQYVEEFYPLWFTYYQQHYTNNANLLAGPDQVTPLYKIVVAINVDTLYASTFLNVASQPAILTIPSTTATYSMLLLDPYGNIYSSGIPTGTPGTFGFTAPGYNGTLPAGVTQVSLPYNVMTLIFRVDLYSSTGQDQSAAAAQFRQSLLLQTMSNYVNNPSGGAASIVPEIVFAAPFKTSADTLVANDAISFLKQLQVAVASSNTPPLTTEQQTLVSTFNSLFGNGTFTPATATQEAAFIVGAQTAHSAIINNYLNNTGPTNWITFTDIGNWGTNYLDRSSITEFIQYGNGRSTAAYYHTFKDSTGAALDGTSNSYVLTFPAGQIPQASRFWSVTAYTPDSVELIPNTANKYAVASYTPGLVTNSDGSISIYVSATQPSGVPTANWLPVSTGPFNLMLRVYGPQGSVANNTYVPPAVVARPLD